MKRINLILLLLLAHLGALQAQDIQNWRLKKTEALHHSGLQTEGHDLKFKQELFQKEGQFIEVLGGMGVFAPSQEIGQNLSGGLMFNKGSKKHFLSLGMHLTYSVSEMPSAQHILNKQTYAQTALIGYHFHHKNVNFKFLIEPVSISPESSFAMLPTGTIGFGCHF